MYPLSLNSYVASPTFFSETTPRGHAPLTAWSTAGVECSGGPTTRNSVADEKDMANGVLTTGGFSETASTQEQDGSIEAILVQPTHHSVHQCTPPRPHPEPNSSPRHSRPHWLVPKDLVRPHLARIPSSILLACSFMPKQGTNIVLKMTIYKVSRQDIQSSRRGTVHPTRTQHTIC